MTALKSVTKWLLFCLFVLVVLGGCKKSTITSSTDEVESIDVTFHVDMQYFNFDKVNDLFHFFDSLRHEHGITAWDNESCIIIEKNVFKCIEMIDGYRKGKYKYYPDSLVNNCINYLGHDNAALANHTDSIDIGFSEWFLMMAAYYSPDITCLVHMQTPNHRAGVQNFGSQYNYNPWWSYIFLKRNKGFEVRRIRGDETKIDKIFQMEDDKHRLYYLCSNNLSDIEFLQVLFWVKSDDDVVLVTQCDSLPNKGDFNYDEIYFNPEKKVWHYCKEDKKTGNLIPVSETPALSLFLDGDNSRFIQ